MRKLTLSTCDIRLRVDTVNLDGYHPVMTTTSIKEDCVLQAMKVIADKGLEGLSLRAVARELGVSHQAPYKHFASRDHLLAEVIRRCLRDFADALTQSGIAEDGAPLAPEDAMQRLGITYLKYAAENPLAYRLMFATPWPDAARELDLKVDARAAFDILARRLAAVKDYPSEEDHRADALFVWSAIHGLAGVVESEAMSYLDFDEAAAQEVVGQAMQRMDLAVFGKPLSP